MEKFEQLLSNDTLEWLEVQGLVWGGNILAALLIFFIGKWLAGWATRFAQHVMRKGALDETLVSFIGNIVFALALAFVGIAAISQLGVETTSLAAVLAAAGLAIGLALQGSLSNLAAGVMIITFRPFRAGDAVEVGPGKTAGTVQSVSIFTTKLLTGDNCEVIVPNNAIINNIITNYSSLPTRKLEMVFGIGYHDDVKRARDILQELITQEPRFLADPKPVIVLGELGASSVNIFVRPWVNSGDYWNVKWDFTEKVKERFDAAGITLPYLPPAPPAAKL